MLWFLLIWIFCVDSPRNLVSGRCFFPPEYAGKYQVQSSINDAGYVSYLEVDIQHSEIPIWGVCYKQFGDHIILHIGTDSGDCYRCFHVVLRTPNILQVNTEGLEKCYINVEAAESKCPEADSIKPGDGIFLWRIEEQSTTGFQYCPLDGRFNFVYTLNGEGLCNKPLSIISNCPSGDKLTVEFRSCAFSDRETKFQCLGTWPAENGETYIALMEQKTQTFAKYRCALYKEHPDTGQIYVSLSPDSTCSTELHNATDGFEILQLSAISAPAWPTEFQGHQICHFPEWMQGEWEHASIHGEKLNYKGISSEYTTYSANCLSLVNGGEKIQLYGRTQCGEELFVCLWVKQRSTNVMELRTGRTMQTYNESLCADTNFMVSNHWETQARKNLTEFSDCPFQGELHASLSGGTCSTLRINCSEPSHLFYSQSSCDSPNKLVFEDRQYTCLGSWEQNGLIYTYTKRKDQPGVQCFISKVYGKTSHVLAVGENCLQGTNPVKEGVNFTQTSFCENYIPPLTTHEPRPQLPAHETTTSISNEINRSIGSQQLFTSFLINVLCFFIILVYQRIHL